MSFNRDWDVSSIHELYGKEREFIRVRTSSDSSKSGTVRKTSYFSNNSMQRGRAALYVNGGSSSQWEGLNFDIPSHKIRTRVDRQEAPWLITSAMIPTRNCG